MLLGASGAAASGAHYIDDHEIAEFTRTWSHTPFLRFMWIEVLGDLGGRFRPFYYVQRTTLVALLGDHFIVWSLYGALLAVVTALLLFAFARRLGWAVPESAGFALVALIGPQAAIWWRLGTNETYAMPLLAVSLLALAFSVRGRHRLTATCAFVCFAVLASLTKESFIAFVPGLVFLKVWLERTMAGPTWRAAVRRSLVPGAFLLAVMLAEAATIKLTIDTNVGYASNFGFHPGGGLTVVLFLVECYGAPLLVLGVLGWVALRRSTAEQRGRFGSSLVPAVAFTLIAVVPETLLYAKSGIRERYLNPSATAMAVLILCLVVAIETLRPDWRPWLLGMLAVGVLVTSVYSFHVARIYAADGVAFNGMLHAVASGTRPSDHVLIAADSAQDFEFALSTREFLTYTEDRPDENVYLLVHPDVTVEDLRSDMLRYFGKAIVASASTVLSQDAAVVLRLETEHEFDAETTGLSGFHREVFGDYVVYLRRAS